MKKGVVAGEGDIYKKILIKVNSAVAFYTEISGQQVSNAESPVVETFGTEVAI